MIVAIHQPNFLPWLGFFDKILRSDTFVLLDDVQYPKQNAKWINRVYIPINKSEKWVNIIIDHSYSGVKLINEITLNTKVDWRRKLLNQLEHTYKKHPFYNELGPWLETAIAFPTNSLCDYNLNFLFHLIDILNLDRTKIKMSSELNVDGVSNERLINITQSLGGTTYLAGGGSGEYQEDDKFSKAGIEVKYQSFQHPAYPQRKNDEFMPGMSIIDCLMNIGIEDTKMLIHKDIHI